MPDPRFSVDRLRVRLWFFRGLCILIFGALALRLVELQLVRGAALEEEAKNNRVRREIIHAHRGQILDRHGRVLADNSPAFHLLFDPRDRAFHRNRPRLVHVVGTLAEILDRDPERLLEMVDQARKGGLPPITIARGLDFRALSILEERPDWLPGVEVRSEPARRYPHGPLAAHLIGYLGEVSEEEVRAAAKEKRTIRRGDLIGRAGVERTYGRHLRGVDGAEYVEVDAHGRRTHLFAELPADPSTPGQTLVLAVDLILQQAAEAALDSARATLVRENPRAPATAGNGSVVALDPRTGEILAMASRPAFDPNRFVSGLSAAEWREISGAGHPLLNRAIQASYPPGSTFKVVTALAGMRDAHLTPGTAMPTSCSGGFPFGQRTFRCWKKEGHGTTDLLDAMTQSCDVYFYQLGLRLGTERMMQFAYDCSLGVPTRVDLPQERTSLIPTREWFRRERGREAFPGSALNLAIGQGEILLTPIALARLVSAVVNGGTLVTPRAALHLLDDDGEPLPEFPGSPPVAGRLPVSSHDLAAMRAMLEAVVMEPHGTGKRARVEPFRVGGKTGTAQNPHGEDHALFFGFAPAEEPEIVVVAVLEQSGGGGAMAAPAVRRVLEAYLQPRAGAIAVREGP